MSFLYEEGIVVREYVIASTTTASTAVQIKLPDNWPVVRVVLESDGDDIIYKFGNSTVVADKTVTGSVRPDGNFRVTDGAIIGANVNTELESNGGRTLYVSTQTATTNASAIIKLMRGI